MIAASRRTSSTVFSIPSSHSGKCLDDSKMIIDCADPHEFTDLISHQSKELLVKLSLGSIYSTWHGK